MNQSSDSADVRAGSRRWGFEISLAVAALAFGFLVLPALIYLVGTQILGPYGGGAQRMGSFYGDLFQGLGSGSSLAWCLVLGPAVLLLLLRLVLLGRQASAAPPPSKPAPKQERIRKEPSISL